MDLQNEKCVMVIDENLPLGIIANTAAIMGITLGKQMPEVVGYIILSVVGCIIGVLCGKKLARLVL